MTTSNEETSGTNQPVSPSISLPKGGGAIRGIGEKFAANPVTGTGSMSVPIATTPGRSGFEPQLTLSYDSGAGNGPFGFGWNLSLPSITRATDKRLPQYRDQNESDVFVLSGTDDLVPEFKKDFFGSFIKDEGNFVVHEKSRTINGVVYRVRRYRPRVEGLFARIERWTNSTDQGDSFWRSISKDNITTWYGRTADSRITDPSDPGRIFSWLTSESYDDKGNVITYGYKEEDSSRVFEFGEGSEDRVKGHERNRTEESRSPGRYLKKIRYANRVPYFAILSETESWPEPPDVADPDASRDWLFEVVFDYGEHDTDVPTPDEVRPWPARSDPFSTYRAGFEVRTYRLCQRVLMFHHFPDEAGVGANCLVRSTDLTYSDEVNPTHVRNPVYTFLSQITQTGYRRKGSGYDSRRVPPVEFEYSEPVVEDEVEEVDFDSVESLPVGLDGRSYRWTDLHGEGLPGILTEQGGSWFYKRNLSPIPIRVSGSEVIKAKLAPLELVALRPNFDLGGGGVITTAAVAELMDLAGDGQPDVVMLDGPSPGLYEHEEDEGWQPFRPFMSRLNRDLRDPNLRFVDLDGDGRADVLITEDEMFVWHASLGEEGFGEARRAARALDEEKGPRIAFDDGTQSIYLADLSGDGLADIVRIRNGEICYWPNLGYCRFGRKITMDNAPWFDEPDQFEQKRVRLADIDGSGTTDIIYLHRDGVRLYFNQSGNSWSSPTVLKVFPHVDDVVSISVIDLLGNGTACLVWSSPFEGDARRPMRYVNLMGGGKPHLLVKSANNLGAETQLEYAPSTKFYLQDKRDGKPWITRLPFPVHVVENATTYDHISRNRFVTRYAYHHGYFDGEEREFRGFGLVEQWDTEEFAALDQATDSGINISPVSHVPAVRTKTWFYTGTFSGQESITRLYENAYFREPGLDVEAARELLLETTILPTELTPGEAREACRAAKGLMLRREIYAEDADHAGATSDDIRRASLPYTVIMQNFAIRTLQPRGSNRHAVFHTHVDEAITYQYDRNPSDPRIKHALTLEVDDFGNPLKMAAISYGRRRQIKLVDDQGDAHLVSNPGLNRLDLRDQVRQTNPLMTFTESRVSNFIDLPDTYRAPVSCEVLTFELTDFSPSGPRGRFRASDLVEPNPGASGPVGFRLKFDDQVPYESTATGNPCRRPIQCLRTLYRRDNLDGLLPVGELESLALPGATYKLAFTTGLLEAVFLRPRQGQPDEPLLPDMDSVLSGTAGDQGGYLQSQTLKADGRFPHSEEDGLWWIPSGQAFNSTDPSDGPTAELAKARQHCFVTRRHRDPFGNDTLINFDPYDLLVVETLDPVGNRITVEDYNYRVLQPSLLTDANRNRTRVAFDALGMVVGTAVMGKAMPNPVEGDSLDGFDVEVDEVRLEEFMTAPRYSSINPGESEPAQIVRDLLGSATSRFLYDLDRFRRLGKPSLSATIVRETHVSDLEQGRESRLQISLSYSDGFAREIQRKIPAEPGPLVEGGADINPRWVTSGWTIFNNKGKPVRQYEPFFSATHEFEFGAMVGVSSVLFYDPSGNTIATLHPNHTYEKAVFDPWEKTTYDVNDTCALRNAQTGDPRTDPDVRGYVAEYFKTQETDWQTWHAMRISGAMGNTEREAAERAAAHADTPTTTHFDVLGRPFLTITRNRVVCPNHDLDGAEDSVAGRIELDIEGNRRAMQDERKLPVNFLPTGAIEQRVIMQYDYDMLGNRIRQRSMEAGSRWMLNDVAGNLIRSWDSRGHEFRTFYDGLRRILEQRVRGTTPDSDPRTLNTEILFDKIDYGENVPNAEMRNLRTRIFRHFDAAGVVVNAKLDANGQPVEAYDFKGNLLYNSRQLLTEYKNIPDWVSSPALDIENFSSTTRYDALNRPIQSTLPHSDLGSGKFNVVQPTFNEANLLERTDVWLERAAEPSALLDRNSDAASPVGISNIDYDAKGQRSRIVYKNGVITTLSYDSLTFRLARLVTERGSVAFPDDDPQPPLPDWPGHQVQNLQYTFDPVGNVTHIRDEAQQTIYFRNKRVEPSSDFTYDACYRLIQGTGREHLGQGGVSNPYTFDDAGRTGLSHPNDGTAMGTYTERYVYDAVGNFLQMQHRGSDSALPGWTRRYTYSEASSIEGGKQSNRLTSTQVGNGVAFPPEVYSHDLHGHIVRMPHLGGGSPGPNMFWDYKDRLQVADLGGGIGVFCVYDASGQRVRKIWEKAPGLIEERVYLGGFEIFRKRTSAAGGNAITLERETLHIVDGKQSIALVETRTRDSAGNDQAPRQLIRYQLVNHLGSAGLELDDRAQIISYEEYAPYGSTTYQAVRSQTELPKRYRYTGVEKDEETGLGYHGARYYAPWLGRWLSPDPAGIKAGENLYRYCSANPIVRTDYDGNEDKYCWVPFCGTFAPTDAIKDLVWGAAEGTYDAGKNLKETIENANEKAEKVVEKVITDPQGSLQDFNDMMRNGGPGMLLWKGVYNQGEHFYNEYNAFQDALDDGRLRSASRIFTRNAVEIGVTVEGGEILEEISGVCKAVSVVEGEGTSAGLLVKTESTVATTIEKEAVAGAFAAEDVALGITKEGLREFAGKAELGTLLKAARDLEVETLAEAVVRDAYQKVSSSGGSIRFSLKGFDITKALNPASDIFSRVTPGEFRTVLRDPLVRGRTVFYDSAGKSMTGEQMWGKLSTEQRAVITNPKYKGPGKGGY
jgi:RHS repeat-associated protein